MITAQLLLLKTDCQEIAEEYGRFSVDMRIDIYGRSICYNCIATSIQNPDLVYTVAGKEDTIKDNLRKELEKHELRRFKAHMTNAIFQRV